MSCKSVASLYIRPLRFHTGQLREKNRGEILSVCWWVKGRINLKVKKYERWNKQICEAEGNCCVSIYDIPAFTAPNTAWCRNFFSLYSITKNNWWITLNINSAIIYTVKCFTEQYKFKKSAPWRNNNFIYMKIDFISKLTWFFQEPVSFFSCSNQVI